MSQPLLWWDVLPRQLALRCNGEFTSLSSLCAAAELNHTAANAHLGLFLLEHSKTFQRPPVATGVRVRLCGVYLKRAADAGHVDAMHGLVVWLLTLDANRVDSTVNDFRTTPPSDDGHLLLLVAEKLVAREYVADATQAYVHAAARGAYPTEMPLRCAAAFDDVQMRTEARDLRAATARTYAVVATLLHSASSPFRAFDDHVLMPALVRRLEPRHPWKRMRRAELVCLLQRMRAARVRGRPLPALDAIMSYVLQIRAAWRQWRKQQFWNEHRTFDGWCRTSPYDWLASDDGE